MNRFTKARSTIVATKDGHTYAIRYPKTRYREVALEAARWAVDMELSFNWQDVHAMAGMAQRLADDHGRGK